MILHAIDDYEAHGENPIGWYQALDDVERHAHEIGPEPEPEPATDTRTYYRVQMPAKAPGFNRAERALYDGHVVLADLNGRRDHNGAVTVLYDEGPLKGEECWISPDWLVRWVVEPNTRNEW